MSEIRIKDKRQRLPIKPPIGQGDDILGYIVFNPDDTALYQKLLAMVERAIKGAKSEKEITAKLDAIKVLPDKLDDISDFESAAETFNTASQAIGVVNDEFDVLYNSLNDAFGNGQDICGIFTQGDKDVELLVPIIEAVAPYFKKARNEKTDKYRARKK